MSKDGTNRGGARPGAGRKPKGIAEKIANGNPGGRKLTVLDFGDGIANLEGCEMPPVKEYLKAKQKDGRTTCAEDIFKETWETAHCFPRKYLTLSWGSKQRLLAQLYTY